MRAIWMQNWHQSPGWGSEEPLPARTITRPVMVAPEGAKGSCLVICSHGWGCEHAQMRPGGPFARVHNCLQDANTTATHWHAPRDQAGTYQQLTTAVSSSLWFTRPAATTGSSLPVACLTILFFSSPVRLPLMPSRTWSMVFQAGHSQRHSPNHPAGGNPVPSQMSSGAQPTSSPRVR